MWWATAILLAIFIIVYWLEPRRFVNVYVFGIVFGWCSLIGLVWVLPDILSESPIVVQFYYVLLFAIIPLSLLVISFLTFFNGKILLEKEGRRPRNLLFSSIGVIIVGMVIWFLYNSIIRDLTPTDEIVFLYVAGLVGYGLYLFTSTTLYAILYHYRPILYKPDFIIVLGSGLIGKKVPPLLASRINQAVEEWRKNPSATMIMSGGQGADELVSEAEAMRDYALAHHEDLDEGKVLIENKSTTTYENFLFSKRMMDDLKDTYRIVFVTNNFHVFRASLYARKLKLAGQGVGSKTATYYLANAFTREYIGLLVMTKKIHIVFFILWTLCMAVLYRAYS